MPGEVKDPCCGLKVVVSISNPLFLAPRPELLLGRGGGGKGTEQAVWTLPARCGWQQCLAPYRGLQQYMDGPAEDM